MQDYVSALTVAQKQIDASLAAGKCVYPSTVDIFAALTACPMDRVRVVILGQDPYIHPNQAHGLSFSVMDGHPPPSLRNIFKRIALTTHQPTTCPDGNLQSWARQGVLLLNTLLTVEAGKSNSHKASAGWPVITSSILKVLSGRPHRIVFMLWGRPAQMFAKGIIDTDRHLVLEASHPSPLGATAFAPVPFNACLHFSQCNQALGDRPIVW